MLLSGLTRFSGIMIFGLQLLDLLEFDVIGPAAPPASIRAWTTHFRSISPPTLSFGAWALQAANRSNTPATDPRSSKRHEHEPRQDISWALSNPFTRSGLSHFGSCARSVN